MQIHNHIKVLNPYLFTVFLVLTLNSFAQFTIPEKPKLETSVYDYAKLLSTAEKTYLETKLIQYSDSTSTQIVIAIIESTKSENINYLGAQWGQKWGIGQEKEDNGILILLAVKDKKIAINTGYGVEHLLTDAVARRIIEQDIIPFFRLEQYYEGLDSGAEAIFDVMNGEYKGIRKNKPKNEIPIDLILFLIFIIILIAISNNNRRNGGGNRGVSRGILDAINLSNMGRGSFGRGSGGFGGGGFGGGFGGGGFGGGGASGGW